jgi:indoleamine 2,3-dioxygenase
MSDLPLQLADYGVSPVTGFLPRQAPAPLRAEIFSQWEATIRDLPQLIKDKKVRERVSSLPEVEFNDSTLQSEDEWKRAYSVLSFVGQGYIWMGGDVVKVLPKKLAVPWALVSERLGVKPVINYAAPVLYNYQLKDPAKPLTVDNLQPLLSFTGNEAESWFFMVHVAVEAAAGPGLDAIAHAYQHMAAGDNASICESLKVVRSSITGMKRAATQMYNGCTPRFFFDAILPFLAGSKELPDGLVYEGVDPTPKRYRSASGAQTSTVDAFSTFLGEEYTGPPEQRAFLSDMRELMPKEHRAFLEKLRTMPSIRKYCKNAGQPDLVAHYNDTIQALLSFRETHTGIVRAYVVKASGDDESAGGMGSHIMSFFEGIKKDTLALMI